MHSGWGGYCGNFFNWSGGFHSGGLVMGIIGLLFIGLIVLLIVKGGDIFRGNSEKPEDILKRRYINGEISKEEFLEKKEFLKTL